MAENEKPSKEWPPSNLDNLRNDFMNWEKLLDDEITEMTEAKIIKVYKEPTVDNVYIIHEPYPKRSKAIKELTISNYTDVDELSKYEHINLYRVEIVFKNSEDYKKMTDCIKTLKEAPEVRLNEVRLTLSDEI